MERRHPSNHRRRLMVMAMLAFGFAFLTWRWMWSPAATAPTDVEAADAVVLFAGGRGERLDQSLELMEADVAPVLVISNGTLDGWTTAIELCAGSGIDPGKFEVLCPVPDPDTTQGEARMFADLAEERGWDHLVMVTSTYHATRARLSFLRCYEGDVTTVVAGRGDAASLPRLLTREWLATANARILARSC